MKTQDKHQVVFITCGRKGTGVAITERCARSGFDNHLNYTTPAMT